MEEERKIKLHNFILLFYVVRGRQEAKEELKVLRAISLSLVL